MSIVTCEEKTKTRQKNRWEMWLNSTYQKNVVLSVILGIENLPALTKISKYPADDTLGK